MSVVVADIVSVCVPLTFGMNDTGYDIYMKDNAKELSEQRIAKSLESYREIEAVSYTHLDVYKRQEERWRDNRRAYCDDRFKLSVLFPTDLHAPRVYKNAPFDVCESKLTDTFFMRHSEFWRHG